MKKFVKDKYRKKIVGDMLIHSYPVALLEVGKDVDEILKKYRPYATKKEQRILKIDMIRCYCKYHFWFDEYFMYGLFGLSNRGKYEYISNYDHNRITAAFNEKADEGVFFNKFRTYQRFKKYYKRDLIAITGKRNELTEYRRFVKKHHRAIIKPIDNGSGKGIRIVTFGENDLGESLRQIRRNHPRGCVLEEIIVQSDEFNSIYHDSVNNVRITTLKISDKTIIFHPYICIGKDGMTVSNGYQGGLICLIDKTSGRIFRCKDEMTNEYFVHPNTGHPLLGYEIPKWKEAIILAEELSNVIPECRYVGWDLALTDDGWSMIEGNCRGMFGSQYVDKGVRKEIISYMCRMDIRNVRGTAKPQGGSYA